MRIFPPLLPLVGLCALLLPADSEPFLPQLAPEEFNNDWADILKIYNDGDRHVVDGQDSSSTTTNYKTIVATGYTTLIIEPNSNIEAPLNGYKLDTEWPALRLSIGSTLNGNGGTVTGSHSARDGHGGEAIEIYNGQSSPETASYASFYDGITVAGGDARRSGAGGAALHVHGFGTTATINGGVFRGGKGSSGDSSDDGSSIYANFGGMVEVHSGTFEGDMEVGDSSTIAFYGCFMKNGDKVTGVFVDETYLDVNVRTRDGGEVRLVSVAEQECETAPSSSPTNFPTISMPPTVLRSGGIRMGASCVYIIVSVLLSWCI